MSEQTVQQEDVSQRRVDKEVRQMSEQTVQPADIIARITIRLWQKTKS